MDIGFLRSWNKEIKEMNLDQQYQYQYQHQHQHQHKQLGA